MKRYKDDELVKQAIGWTSITRRITFAARINDQPVPHWKLETTFQCGDGTGRLWRCWMNGDRIARDYTRRNIITKAQELGWLELEGVPVDKIARLPDELIQAVTKQLPGELTDVPLPPTGDHYRSARLIVNTLLSDADSQQGMPDIRKNEFLGAKHYRASLSLPGELDKLQAWESAIKKLRLAIDKLDDKNRHCELKIMRSQLVRQYRMKGFE
ncbi:hypothetical protein [Paraburkholderia kururiensis]|uniref:hypothetical protein n=1 Tax=Paraburkholderia kururiensis TaxID=984307 RepID=UPI0018F73048|nr:hypothetical protein [Paraburkholderia kururiensis]